MIVALGQIVRDTITGLEGVAIGRTEWLQGCVRVSVQPYGLKDGKPYEATWVDEPQLEVIDETAKPAAKRRTGGPQRDPQWAGDPNR